jgi:2-polyprenyl-3-methyl-5-hydroxy-6-metoxy-1,4-benzoquinol methylase
MAEKQRQWYEELFSNFARTYDRQSFTAGTLNEVDFIEKEIGYNKGTKILDVGCGTGRHAIELAKRGYDVTGIDLSADQLSLATEKAWAAGVVVNFHRQDARLLNYTGIFDLAIMICEGAFPLMETDEMNFQILFNVTRALSNNGKLIMTTLNGLFSLSHSTKNFTNENQDECLTKSNRFDPESMRDTSTFVFMDDSGNKKEITTNERYYLPGEIDKLLRSLNYKSIAIYGCECGNFSKSREPAPGDFEMLVIADK